MAWIAKTFKWCGNVLDFFTPLGDLAARVWVAYSFFKSGLLKATSWQSTIMLFTHEFHVPLLSPHLAAVLATGLELVLPVLLLLGLGTRLVAFIFFVFNLIAVFSYPFLLTPEGGPGLAQHIGWGLLLALLMFHGTGRLSIDYWIRRSKKVA